MMIVCMYGSLYLETLGVNLGLELYADLEIWQTVKKQSEMLFVRGDSVVLISPTAQS